MLIALLVIGALAFVVLVFTRIAARPPFRARYDAPAPYERGDRGLAVRSWLPPLTINRRRGT